jgi:hypothetical protein
MAAGRNTRTCTGTDPEAMSQGSSADPCNEPGLTVSSNHPLGELVGKYEGEAWEAVLEAIQRNRSDAAAEADEAA